MPYSSYLIRFISIKGVLDLLVGVFPFVAHFAGWEKQRVVPPLENDLLIIYAILLVMVVLATYCLRFVKFFSDTRWLTSVIAVILLMLACASCVKYIAWEEKVIRCGQVQPQDRNPETRCVIIGLERSERAEKIFSNFTDEKMLQKRGWYREQVRFLWTPESINKARVRVIVYYLAMPLLLVAMISVLILRQCIDEESGTINP